MGGYGQYVWPSYIAMIVIFTISILLPLRRFRQLKAKLRSQIRIEF